MSIRRVVSLSILAIFAIAGGLFVSDRRTAIDGVLTPRRIPAGEALRLGLLLADTPATVERNQAIVSALFILRDQVNRCGGVNEAPVFWSMRTPTAETMEEVPGLEMSGIKTLLWQDRVHGAIAAFTNAPISHALYSDALNLAIESHLPVISPLNTQFWVAQKGRFEQFRRDRPIVTAQTEYWVRTIPSDRQQIAAIAQWLDQKDWTQVVIIAPETPNGEELEELLTEAIQRWSNPAAQTEQVRYQVTTVTTAADNPPETETENGTAPENIADLDNAANPEAEPEATPNPEAVPNTVADLVPSDNPDGTAANPEIDQSDQSISPQPSETATETVTETATVTFSTDLDLKPWEQQPPDAVILMLDPDISRVSFVALMNSLTQFVDPAQTAITIGNDIDSFWSLLNPPTPSLPPSPTPPLTAFYGIGPHFPSQGRQQLSQYGLSSNLDLPPSVFYAWDGAALMMLAAEAADFNSRQGIESKLRTVANPPGMEVTDVCQGLEALRKGEPINYQGISGTVDIDNWGNVNPTSQFDVWQMNQQGDRPIVATLDWQTK